MNTIEILSKLEKVKFTTDQARTITEIIEDFQNELAIKNDLKPLATKDAVQSEILKAKYDLVKWIVGGIIANGAIATLLRFFA